MVFIPAFCYLVLHGLGFFFPARLWGVDQLYYYPPYIAAAFAATALATWIIATRYPLAADNRLARLGDRCDRPPFNGPVRAAVLLLCFFLLAWTLRVWGHSLGDSSMWIANMEIMRQGQAESIRWIIGLPIAGLEHVPAHQSLDFLVHYYAYLLLHALWGGTPADAYRWLSLLVGVPYIAILWQLARLLGQTRLDRLTYFALLATLGTLQYFCGYGESYTLMTAMMALYALQSLRHMRGTVPLWQPSLCLLAAVALHLMALALLPSYAYLLWRDPGKLGTALRRPRLYRPLLVTAAAVGVYIYISFYRFHHPPLWRAEVEGRYPLLSVPHLANLLNALLLVSPFGLVWGLATRRNRPSPDDAIRFAGWGALGPGALICVHNIAMGGRDWDLMAFPGFFLALWGLLRLGQSARAEHWLRQARLFVVPLMVLHTGLWIGINASEQRSIDRLGNLLLHTPNQPRYYQAFTRGHYYLNIRRAHYDQAIAHFREAIAHHPGEGVERYEHFLSRALINLAGDYHAQNRLREALAACAEAVQLNPQYADGFYNLGLTHLKMGDDANAVQAFTATTRLDPQNAQAYYALGMAFLRQGDRRGATGAYETLKALQPALATRLAAHLSPP